MSGEAKSRRGKRPVQYSKSLDSFNDVYNEDRRRPTASERARKARQISATPSSPHDAPFNPPFVESNNEEEHNLESFERTLISMDKGKGLMSTMEEGEEGEEVEDDDRDDDDVDEVQVDEDYSPEEEHVVEDEYVGDHCRAGKSKQRKEILIEKYEILKEPIEGSPLNPELLKSFRGHVAYYIWHGKERKVLKGHKQNNRLMKWASNTKDVMDLISLSGLSHLLDNMHSQLDMPLICAFIERWQPETNSFHLPFGEMTITLHDVAYILGIPIGGRAISDKFGFETIKNHLCTVFKLSEGCVDKVYLHGLIKLDTIQKWCNDVSVTTESIAQGYLLWLLGCTIFVDRSSGSVSPYYISYLLNLDEVKDYAWGAACLAFLYRQLGRSSRFGNAQIGGCLTLLQTWIFEYFPMFRPSRNEYWDPSMPHAQKWRLSSSKRKEADALLTYRRLLDNIKVDEVSWTPFDKNPHLSFPITLYSGLIHCRTIREPYMPDRVMRQFGYVQIIPSTVLHPIKCYRGPESSKYVCTHDENVRSWETWVQHCLRVGELGSYRATFVTESVEGYNEYYHSRTHPRVNKDIFPGSSCAQPSQMSDSARLQYLGARLYPLHPDVRHLTDDTTFYQCLDDVTRHMEDWMPKLQEHRHKGSRTR